MIRSALLLCALLAAAISPGCEAPMIATSPAPAPPSPQFLPLGYTYPVTAAAQICKQGDADSFIKAIRVLDASYDPLKRPYTTPLANSQPYTTRAPLIEADLRKAFNQAPGYFQRHLCSLRGIFISPAACSNGDVNNCNAGSDRVFTGSWGFRSYDQHQGDAGNTYIAFSAALWPSGGSAWALHIYENAILQSLLAGSPFPGAATIDSANVDDSWVTVLAALAHEVGHVRWILTNGTSTPGGTLGHAYEFGYLHSCNGTGDFFGSWNYANDNQLAPPGRWRSFGNQANAGSSNRVDHASYPTLKSLDTAGDARTFDYRLFQLYQDAEPWTGLFGAQTPDEDFVETYVMYVLTGYTPTISGPYTGPLTTLPLTIPGYTGPGISYQRADVPRDLLAFGKTELTRKLACIPL